jgi:hypothetical protein
MSGVYHLGGDQPGLFLKFATRHVGRVGSWGLFPRPLRKLPISGPDWLAILLDELDTAVVFDRNDG